jgi:hypothetical protein
VVKAQFLPSIATIQEDVIRAEISEITAVATLQKDEHDFRRLNNLEAEIRRLQSS